MPEQPANAPQPLPLFEASDAEKRKPASPAGTLERDHEDATWYRLVTAIASCYTYVLLHTDVDPVRFTLAPDGTGACYVAAARRWEVDLTPAAYAALPVVVDLWRGRALNRCEQVIDVALGEPRHLPDGTWSVDVTAAVGHDARTRTLARP